MKVFENTDEEISSQTELNKRKKIPIPSKYYNI